MNLKNSRRHLLSVMCVGFLALLFVSEVNAGPNPVDAPLIVDSVNVGNGTITLEGETYSVTNSSRLMDESGNSIRLSSIRGPGGALGPHLVVVTLRGASREISTLEIIPGLSH